MISNAIGPVAVTELGLGTADLGDLHGAMTPGTAAEIVDAAWDAGIRYFDTAPHYGLGLAERNLGLALGGRPRDEYALSTKVGRLIVDEGRGPERRWDFSAAGVRASLDSSLARLGVDRVDIALLHDPHERMPSALDEGYPALHDLRAQGVVGAIGAGSRDLPTLLRLVTETDVDVVMVAGRLNLLDASALDALVPLCLERGVRVLVAGVFASGILALNDPPDGAWFDYAPASDAVMDRARSLASAARRSGTTLPAAALAFARRVPGVASVVVGAESAAQVREVVARAGGEVDDGVWETAPMPTPGTLLE